MVLFNVPSLPTDVGEHINQAFVVKLPTQPKKTLHSKVKPEDALTFANEFISNLEQSTKQVMGISLSYFYRSKH